MDRFSEHFIHELIGFASSRQYTIAQYERRATYMRREQSRHCAQMLHNRTSHLTPGAPRRLVVETRGRQRYGITVPRTASQGRGIIVPNTAC